jgi:hypothetical protein
MNHRIYVLIVNSEELRQLFAKLELAHLTNRDQSTGDQVRKTLRRAALRIEPVRSDVAIQRPVHAEPGK